MANAKRPRKKKYDLSDIKNPEQRAVATILKPIIDGIGWTMKEIAKYPPSTSLTILNSMFNPETDGVASPRTYKNTAIKFAKLNDKLVAEELYIELMKAAKLDYRRYPFDQSEPAELQLAEDTIKSELMPLIINLPIPCKMPKVHYFREPEVIERDGYSQKSYFYHDLTCDYSSSEEAPIKYWAIDIYSGIAGISSPLKSFFYNILADGTDCSVKYSIVTDSKELFDKVTSMSIPSLKQIVSAIYFDGNTFTETYIDTGYGHIHLDNAGLIL